ncbi:MAG TPA: NAD(P)/FAD-dependent oxidoreductase [Ignavibacteria bacterium]|jgi:putative flavoprotein involved in K+ transport
MEPEEKTETFKVIVIGAGQAGLSVGYFLLKFGIPFVIIDANQRVGDAWRSRWSSLRLFTPAKYDGLVGMPFPAQPYYFPSKDEMADYLEKYAEHFKMPVRTCMRVNGLSRQGNLYRLSAGDVKFQAEHVVIAMSNYQNPKIPAYAKNLNQDILQIHSCDYRDPSQLKEGDVLVVGAGNSGCEIALEAAKNNHHVWLSGRDVGHFPFNIEGLAARIIFIRLMRFLSHRAITTSSRIGRKIKRIAISKAGPLVRLKPKEIIEAGIERIPKVIGVRDGMPLVEDERILNVKNVVWSTGFYPSFSWIDIPVFKEGQPVQQRGVVNNEPGLYFLGLHFLYSPSSAMIHGAARDARFVVNTIAKRLGL